jgi:hypothetical protein
LDSLWLIAIVFYKKLLKKLDVEKRRTMMSRYNSNWGSHDQLQDLRKQNMVLLREIDKWRGLATMMSHFDICIKARISCNICAEARQAYVEALTK